jgi:hypothetical protein
MLEAISQVCSEKEQVGSTEFRNKNVSVKEKTLTRDELSPGFRERYDAAVEEANTNNNDSLEE